MARLVLKFGGSSVAEPDRVRGVADLIARERERGHELVVVVSAMGDATDDLIALASQVSDDPRRSHPREFAMLVSAGERISVAPLAMAVREGGGGRISRTGKQAGGRTDGAQTGRREHTGR